jgi:hypothetical protein
MKSAYDFSMRHGSRILFGLSIALLLIGLGQAAAGLRTSIAQSSASGMPPPQTGIQWLLLLTGTFSAFSAAALPFIGAVLVHRWDASRRSAANLPQQGSASDA